MTQCIDHAIVKTQTSRKKGKKEHEIYRMKWHDHFCPRFHLLYSSRSSTDALFAIKTELSTEIITVCPTKGLWNEFVFTTW